MSNDSATGFRPHDSRPEAKAFRAISTPSLTKSESVPPIGPKVIAKTKAMMAKKQGMPVKRPVRSLSTATLRLCSLLSWGRTTVLLHRSERNEKRIFAKAASLSIPASFSMEVMSSSMEDRALSGRLSFCLISSSPSTILVAANRRGTEACSA